MKHTGPACRQCRSGKRRCSRPIGEACQQCIRRALNCSTASTLRRNAELQPASRPEGARSQDTVVATSQGPVATRVHPSEDTLGPLTTDTVADLVEMYIRFIHNGPHTLFHEPTLRSDVASGAIDQAVLYCILAIAARFASSAEIRARGPEFASKAREILKANLEVISLSSIQAWILLGNVCGAERDSTSESLYFGIAIRSAQIIGLSNVNAEESAVLRETKSRVWWTLYMIDRWVAAGLGHTRHMPERQPTQRLPLDETEFYSLSADQMHWSGDGKPGLWAYMITLAELFGPIQDLNRALAFHGADEFYISSIVGELSKKLEDWQSNLPEMVKLSAETLAFHKARGQGRTFVALHLGSFHYSTLLFFQYLDQSAAAMPYAEIYAERCREHASAYSDLLRTSYEVGECEAMYNIVGHMTVVSSSVLIHTLLFGEEGHLPAAKARLESNFKILMKLRQWWPSMSDMTNRLFVFQNACLRSADTHTHKVDRWMMKFLLEHAIALGEKSDAEALDYSTPQSLDSADPPELQRLAERGHFTRHALSGLRN